MASGRTQRVKKHQVWADLNNLDQHLADAGSLLPSDDPEAGEAYVSLLALSKHTRTVLKSMNALIAPSFLLDSVDSAIQTISSSVTSANQLEDPDQLTTAWNQASTLLNALATLPVVKSRHDATAMTEAMAQFQQQVRTSLEAFGEQADQLSTEIGDAETRQATLSNQIAEQRASAAQTLSEFETKMSTASEEFETQLASLQETQEAENAAAFTAVEERLTAAETQATEFYSQDETRHIEQMKEFRTEFDTAQAERDTQAKTTAEAYTTQADEIIAALQAEFEEGKKLVEMISEVTMTGHYQRNADEQKEEADRWRKWTAIVTGVTVVWAIGIAIYGSVVHEDRDWLDYVTRIGVTVALAALAGYLGTQARVHRQRETHYRTLELELATLDPFINLLDDIERQKIKGELALRYFQGNDSDKINSRSGLKLMRAPQGTQPDGGSP